MKFKIKPIFLVGIIFYLFFFYYLVVNLKQENLAILLENFNSPYIFFAISLEIILILWQGYFLAKIFRFHGIQMRIREATTLWLLLVASSAFTAGVGGPLLLSYRVYQKTSDKKAAFEVPSSFFFFYALPNFLLILIIAIIFLGGQLVGVSTLLRYLIPLSIIIFLFLIGLIFWRNKVVDYLGHMKEYFRKIKADWKGSIELLAISSAKIILNVLLFTMVLKSFLPTVEANFLVKNFFIYEALSILSPSGGGIGFVEIGLAASLTATGLIPAQAATFTLVFRLIEFWLPFVLGGAFAFKEFSRKS